MVTAQFEEMARMLSADASLMRRTKRIVRMAKLKRTADWMLEGLAGLALVWI